MADRDGFPAAPPNALATGAGNRRALLLEAVLADPMNLDAQQVYADALVSANDPRGAFIQLDAALDNPLPIRKREAIRIQRDAMFAAHAKTWWPFKARIRVTRGFVRAISGSLPTIEAAAAVFATEPVWEVEVRGLRAESVERLLGSPWLPRARRLLLRGKIGDAGFQALVESPAIAHVETLNVTGNRIGAAGLTALASNLPSCKTLVLTRNKIQNDGVIGLVRWQHLGQLETLYLGRCGLTAEGVGRLLDGPPLTKLGKLALTGNSLGDNLGAQLAGKAHKLPALRHLELVNTNVNAANARAIASALPTVQRIDLRSNRIAATAVADEPRIIA